MRADVFLVEGGHAATRSQAQRLIASGVEWRLTPLSAWNKVVKNGDDIPPMAEVRLLDDAEAKYISRGGLKLEGALKAALEARKQGKVRFIGICEASARTLRRAEQSLRRYLILMALHVPPPKPRIARRSVRPRAGN